MVQAMLYALLVFACLFHKQVWSLMPVQNEETKALKRDIDRGIKYGTFVVDSFHYLDVNKIGATQVTTFGDCGVACVNIESCFSFNVAVSADNGGNLWCEFLATDKYNSSDKLQVNQSSNHYSIDNPCSKSPCPSGSKCIPLYEQNDYKCECLPDQNCAESCHALRESKDADGAFSVFINMISLLVFCDMTTDNNGWTLVARFSNNDDNNWMKDDGEYWYSLQSTVGKTTDPADNADMISPAFWSVKGTEFKITRSDDSSHTALLYTTGECLNGQTFRSKVTSYGDFSNGEVWASDSCLGACDVQYGGQYQSTAGFSMVACDGDIQTRGKIGFWCDWSSGDGAVMMVGGGGSSCSRADHGIGITEANDAAFQSSDIENDFGSDSTSGAVTSYSLNLWVR